MTTPPEELLPATRRALLHRLARTQSEGRAPSVVAAVVRDGGVVWGGSRSASDDQAPGPDTQYRIGSITKTFTAVLILRLRDEGLLDLRDPLEKHVPGTGAGEVTIAQLLSHSGGLAAESPGPWWERTPGSLRPHLADILGEEPFRHPSGRVHHYSNLGYALLGAVVEQLRGASWEDVLRREVLEPLSLHRTAAQPSAPYAEAWAVHPWADVLLPEPVEDYELMAPAGQLWSTTADLARFAVFLSRGDDRVLSAESVREMRTPAAPSETRDLAAGVSYGLGTQVLHIEGRTFVGHGGSVPGFLAAMLTSVDDDLTAVVLANCTSGAAVFAAAVELVGIVAEAEPRLPQPWRPLREVDHGQLELTGPWYWGPSPYALRLSAGSGVVLDSLNAAGRGSHFRALEDGTWLGLEGYFAGEVLRAVRRPDGSVSHLDIGSFVFTREPYEAGAPVPGGVDPEGWRGLKQ